MSKILILTIPPFDGGVPAKTAILARFLRSLGHEITIAYYATISKEPELSKSMITGWNKLSTKDSICFDDFNAVAVGSFLPELEFTYYLPSDRWINLINSHDYHIAVGGTVMISYPLLKANVPHLVWCASTMIEDREDRRAAMPTLRKVTDKVLIGRVQSIMEREILSGNGIILPVSLHAKDTLLELSPNGKIINIMPIPVDCDELTPDYNATEIGLIGFAGRISDPRKNIKLLINAVEIAKNEYSNIKLILTGNPHEEINSSAIEFTGVLTREKLVKFYKRLDVFVIPSKQEGFGIVGIEAMACGVPVITTPCGGPADYVINNQTGFIADFTPETIAKHIINIINDRKLRHILSKNARNMALNNYSHDRFKQVLQDSWFKCWGSNI